MRRLTIFLPLFALFGCATTTQQGPSPIVTTAISAPRLLYMNAPPTSPVVQATTEQKFSPNGLSDFSRFWIDVAICENGVERCAPAIGVVTLIQKIDEVSKDGLVDVSIALSNSASIEMENGNTKSSIHQSVGAEEAQVSYGVVGKRVTFPLSPGAERRIDLPHGIGVTIRVL